MHRRSPPDCSHAQHHASKGKTRTCAAIEVSDLPLLTSVNHPNHYLYLQDKESKRRRLTSETGGCLLPRGAGEALHAAEYAQLAALLPDDVIRSQLVAWGKALKEAQPKVRTSPSLTYNTPSYLASLTPKILVTHTRLFPLPFPSHPSPSSIQVFMSEHLIECGLCLYKYLRHLQVNATMDGRLSPAYFANQQLIMHDIIGCWWIGLKCCSIRTAVPNRALMCKATGANPPLLADCELAALIAMDWEATAVLREHGLIQ